MSFLSVCPCPLSLSSYLCSFLHQLEIMPAGRADFVSLGEPGISFSSDDPHADVLMSRSSQKQPSPALHGRWVARRAGRDFVSNRPLRSGRGLKGLWGEGREPVRDLSQTHLSWVSALGQLCVGLASLCVPWPLTFMFLSALQVFRLSPASSIADVSRKVCVLGMGPIVDHT